MSLTLENDFMLQQSLDFNADLYVSAVEISTRPDWCYLRESSRQNRVKSIFLLFFYLYEIRIIINNRC